LERRRRGQPDPAGDIIARLTSGLGEAEGESELRRMNSTRKRSAPPEQIEGEEESVREAVAETPEQEGAQTHNEGIVDRGRMDGRVDGIWIRPGRHRPRVRPGIDVVAVAESWQRSGRCVPIARAEQ